MNLHRKALWLAGLLALSACWAAAEPHALVLQTDFGTKDGAVSAMRGVAFGVSPTLPIFDLSHENTPFDTWEASYRLNQTAAFWPSGTVFVSVIDPGVGTERHAVVLKTKSGHYFVGPDNGSFTLVAETLGVEAVRLIDETKNRRPGSERSHTFHGRDVFVYVGAKLASGAIDFAGVGPSLEPNVIMLPYEKAKEAHGALTGNIPFLDFQFGNVWTNIDETLFTRANAKPGDRFKVTFLHDGKTIFQQDMPYMRTFGDVPEGQPLLYLNSLMNVAVALNQGDYVKAHGIGYGANWSIRIEKLKR